jgi:hypothetical protein
MRFAMFHRMTLAARASTFGGIAFTILDPSNPLRTF